MEQRQHARLNAVLDVDIVFRATPMGRYRTHDLSHGGMFLLTSSIDLNPGNAILLGVNHAGGFSTMRAIVIHRSPEGIGLMLTVRDLPYRLFVRRALESRWRRSPLHNTG